MKIRAAAVVAVLLSISACGCSVAGLLGLNDSRLIIMSYNLHNLFDAACDGSEYAEFCPEQSDWNELAYAARLEDFGKVIRGTAGTYGHGPDIVVLTEVEHQGVVEDLRNRVLGQRRYPFAVATRMPDSAIQIGLLSRIPVDEVFIHAVYPRQGKHVRPIMEAVLQLSEPEQDRLHLFACHWPSKLGGEAETEPLRLQAAAVLQRRIEQLLEENSAALILIAGDLNQTLPEDMDRPRSAEDVQLRSLMSVDSLPDEWKDSAAKPYMQRPLLVTGAPARAALDPMVFFTPWGMTDFPGSYVYQQEWEEIDHFLLGSGLLGEVYAPVGFRVEAYEWMLTPGGYPRAYRPSQRTGLSDHLPIVLELERVSQE